MSRKWILKLCAPVATAAILVGCTQEVSPDADRNRTPIDNASNQQRQNRPIKVTGCLGPGPGTDQYVLTHVKPAPLAEQPSDMLSSTSLTLPDNSAVRLAVNDDDQLRGLVGQTVSVTGLIRDDGRNTIGTSGPPVAPDQAEPRTDQSQAATDKHHSDKVRAEAGPIGQRSMNNGTYPELTVQQLNGTGQKCVASPAEERR
ncbi:MAG TPA: hypothetical protein VJ813_12265 [Vicinamibacterales bacterium]|nr:hypothetical protein [Vicinamibacterales bacterium]